MATDNMKTYNSKYTGAQWDAGIDVIYQNSTIPINSFVATDLEGKSNPIAINTITKNSDLAIVAKSGSYNDLKDKPSIPNINNLVTLTGSQIISGHKEFNSDIRVCKEAEAADYSINKINFYNKSGQQTLQTSLEETDEAIYTLTLPKKTGTLATTDEIPTINNLLTIDDTIQSVSGEKTFQHLIIPDVLYSTKDKVVYNFPAVSGTMVVSSQVPFVQEYTINSSGWNASIDEVDKSLGTMYRDMFRLSIDKVMITSVRVEGVLGNTSITDPRYYPEISCNNRIVPGETSSDRAIFRIYNNSSDSIQGRLIVTLQERTN